MREDKQREMYCSVYKKQAEEELLQAGLYYEDPDISAVLSRVYGRGRFI